MGVKSDANTGDMGVKQPVSREKLGLGPRDSAVLGMGSGAACLASSEILVKWGKLTYWSGGNKLGFIPEIAVTWEAGFIWEIPAKGRSWD